MSKISCLIRLGEVPLHLYQITAGFLLLAHQGIINLKVERISKNNKKLPYNMLEVIVNGKIRILYDTNDGYDNLLNEGQNYIRFYNDLLQDYDLCFKRSFSKLYNEKLNEKGKIYPLGLNYMTSIKGNVAHSAMPHDPFKEKVKKVIRKLPFSEYYNGQYYINKFEDIPRISSNPKILFMARLWDINGDFEGQISSDKKEERHYINESRAECIRTCRRIFGDSFFGGVSPSKFAYDYYPDIVIEDKKLTKRNNYLNRVKDSDICISTMGLHKSIGWKFAEYIAASKSIITEELNYELPGNIKEGQNYLVFKTPDECINKIKLLLDDSTLRQEMMLKNFQYYHENIRPDRLVLNSLITVLNEEKVETRILRGKVG
jgi:hypothetical protein